MRVRINTLSAAVVQAFGAGLAISIGAVAHAQTTQSLEKIEVTGSRVKRAEAEGALPVTVITRVELEASGQTTVAEYIRSSAFTTAGNFRPQSGSSAQSFSEVNLRGLGSRRTLVLVDGRRIAKSPLVGDAVDMNSIPLAAVERIEILTDGASAVYGSDAIGGVVNVILRKNFQGVAVSVGATRVSGPEDGGDREEASGIMGITGDKGRVIMGASMTKRDIIFQRHAHGTAGTRGQSIYANNYYTTGFSPIGGVPGGCNDPGFNTIANGQCRFDFVGAAADEASLDTKAFFARGEFNITNDWTAFMTSSVNRVSSFGRYAPVPGFLEIRPGSVAHPWHPSYPDPSLRSRVAQDQTILLAHRFAAGGNRDDDVETNMYDTLLGVKGTFRGMDVEAGLRKSTAKVVVTGRGYVIQTLAEAEINAGNYNIFSPSSTPADILARFTTNIGRDGTFDQTEQYANVQLDLFRLAGGTSRLFVGAERRKEVYADLYDSLSEGGVILGSAGNSAAGTREVKAYSAELLMPITRTLEGTLAIRHEKYSDYGNDTSPKASIRFQPTNNLVFRASVGEGFSAPTLPQLTQKPAFSADSVDDERNCIALGNAPADCVPGGDAINQQVNGLVISNPALTSEKAKQWSMGVAWDATPSLSFKTDLWHTKLEDVIVNITAQSIVDRDNGINPLPIPAGLSITRDANGLITSLVRGSTNEGILTQRGVDVSILFTPSIGRFGSLRHELRWSRVLKADSNGVNFNGDFAFPKNRASLNNMWRFRTLDAAWNVNMIGKNGVEGSGLNAGSYVTHDVQLGWHTPLKAVKLVVGAVNVTGKMPKLVGYDGRAYNYYLYDGYGRQVYGRVEMKF